MKKKIVALLLTMGLAVSLAACGSSSSDSEEASSESSTETSSVSATSDSEETSVDGEYDYSVAFCVFTTEGDYWNYMYGLVEDAFAEYGVSVDIISADNDSVRQIAFCGAERTPMCFRADAMRNITDAPKRSKMLLSFSAGSLLCNASSPA